MSTVLRSFEPYCNPNFNPYYDITLETIFNPMNIELAIRECARCKLWKDSVIEGYVYSDYKTHTILYHIFYDPNGYIFDPLFHTTIFERGKERLICSLTFKDRIIHKLLNQCYILPIFRNKLIYDNMASLEGRGIHRALFRLEAMLQKSIRKFGMNFYIAKCDIKSYFDNIPHQYMFEYLDRYTKDKRIMDLIYRILQQYKYDPYIHNGEICDSGIGLGGEVAQSFGILCLNELDHIMKENPYLKVPHYIRYMDDIIMIDKDKKRLEFCINYMDSWLKELGMFLSPNKTNIMHASEGVKFLKVHFYPKENGFVLMVPNKKAYKKQRIKLIKMKELLMQGEIASVNDIYNAYMSYRGYAMTSGNGYNMINHIDQLFDYLFEEEFENQYVEELVNHITQQQMMDNPV